MAIRSTSRFKATALARWSKHCPGGQWEGLRREAVSVKCEASTQGQPGDPRVIHFSFLGKLACSLGLQGIQQRRLKIKSLKGTESLCVFSMLAAQSMRPKQEDPQTGHLLKPCLQI